MNYTPIIVLAVVIVVFYALMVLPQQRRARDHRTLLAGLKKGDRVMTYGGMFGTVTSLADETVDIEVAKGVVITVARQAISTKVEDKGGSK